MDRHPCYPVLLENAWLSPTSCLRDAGSQAFLPTNCPQGQGLPGKLGQLAVMVGDVQWLIEEVPEARCPHSLHAVGRSTG